VADPTDVAHQPQLVVCTVRTMPIILLRLTVMVSVDQALGQSLLCALFCDRQSKVA
jgi:hypothetical protein